MIIQVIHKKYIRPRRVNVTELNRREINDRVANKATLDAHIFDEAQKDVEDLIRKSVYANFLNSDVYLSYIQVIGFYYFIFCENYLIVAFVSLCKMAYPTHHEAAGVKEEVQKPSPNPPSPLISSERALQTIEDLTSDRYQPCTKIQNSLIPPPSSTNQSR